jgi:pimeloyl-ACP methyl ester carboxylesterase
LPDNLWEDIVARINVNGVGIEHEVIGTGKKTAIITPGGRFSKDTPGIRELAEKLAAGGLRVVIWDRPNCGGSDICFDGPTESIMNADALAGLLQALNVAPAIAIGGSAGARVSMIAASRRSESIAGLFITWISGGFFGLTSLTHFYYFDGYLAAAIGGMKSVAEVPEWKELIARTPHNRAILMRQDPAAFMEKMTTWGKSFVPRESSPVPDQLPSDLRALKMPVMILRSGASDPSHPRATSEAVHALIPGAQIAEPPWGDREFLDRMSGLARGEGLFVNWPMLAPQILDFARA